MAHSSDDTLDPVRQRLRRLRLDEEERVRLYGTDGKTQYQRQRQDPNSDRDFDDWSRILLTVFCSVTGHWNAVFATRHGRNRGNQDWS